MATRPSRILLTRPDKNGDYIATLTPSSNFGWAHLVVHRRNAHLDPFVGHDKLQGMLECKVKELAKEGWKQVSKVKLQSRSASVWIEREARTK